MTIHNILYPDMAYVYSYMAQLNETELNSNEQEQIITLELEVYITIHSPHYKYNYHTLPQRSIIFHNGTWKLNGIMTYLLVTVKEHIKKCSHSYRQLKQNVSRKEGKQKYRRNTPSERS